MGSSISGEDSNSSGGPGAMDDFESLVSGFIERTVEDDEHPRAALVSRKGVVRTEDGISEPLGSPAVVVVTNARLMFITAEQAGLQESSAQYGDIASVSVETGAANQVAVTTRDGVEWRCTLPNANPEVLDAVVRHLRWVGHVRSRLLALEDEIETAAADIREHADRMNWDTATDVYRRARDDLDALISMVQLTTPTADAVLAPELTDIERSLEEANARLYIERARSQLELGRYLVENEEYDRAADVLERATQLRRRAAGQSDAVERADAFAFGRQRDLNEDLERLEWELETVAAEPVRQAQEAAVRAREADDPDAAAEHWETAVRRYDRVLELDWWEQAREATDDIDDAREERDRAVERLVETREAVASERWQEGIHRREQGDTAGATDRFEAAATQLERAHEVAVEFDHPDADDIESQLAEIRATVDGLQNSHTRRSGTDDLSRSVSPTEPDDGNRNGQSDVRDGDRNDQSDLARESTDDRRVVEPDDDESDASLGDERGQRVPSGEADSGADAGNDPTVRLQRETFASDRAETGGWIPPSMSDIVAIETHHELTYDLEEIGLPGDVPADGAATPGESGGDGGEADNMNDS